MDTTRIEIQTAPIQVQVLAVCDNLEAAKGAKGLCDRIQQFLGVEYELNFHLWDAAFLRIGLFARAAVEAAEWPTLLIISVNGNKPLSPYFKRWINQCIRKPDPAMGVMIAQIYSVLPENLELTPAHKELKQIASNAKVAFLSEAMERPDDRFDISAGVHETACLKTKLLESQTPAEIEISNTVDHEFYNADLNFTHQSQAERLLTPNGDY